jgi:hypothetical protein
MSETKKDKNHPMFGKTGENSPRGMLGKFFSKKHKIKLEDWPRRAGPDFST